MTRRTVRSLLDLHHADSAGQFLQSMRANAEAEQQKNRRPVEVAKSGEELPNAPRSAEAGCLGSGCLQLLLVDRDKARDAGLSMNK